MDQAAIFATTEDRPGAHREDHRARDGFRRTLDDMGVELTTVSFERAFVRTQQVANQSGSVSKAQMRAIIDDVVSGTEILQGVAESFR